MPKVYTLPRLAIWLDKEQIAAALRGAIVLGSASALILAGQFLP
ncbi:MAG: hypothetical protein ACK5NN_02465 [Sphingomonadaceae bacterium]